MMKTDSALSDVFLQVLDQHKRILYKVASLYCPEPADRNDLVQEMVIQLWKSFARYNDTYRYSTWIYRIALNVAISYQRQVRRRQALHQPMPEVLLDFADNNAAGVQEEQIRLLHQCIALLKPFDKALLLLYLDEKTYKEMAEIMGLTETNVATKISRIKQVLKQQFLLRSTHD
jgi:RNA polymerase sigma factor (sigma-70 family)